MAEAEDELGRVRHVREATGIDLQRETERGRLSRFPQPPSSAAADEAGLGNGAAAPPLAPLAASHSLGGARGGGSSRMSVASEAPSPSTPLFAPPAMASRSLAVAAGSNAGGMGASAGAEAAHGGAYCAASLLDAARERPVSLLDVLLPISPRAPAERRIAGPSRRLL
jgi:hypothetical protein